MQGFNMGRYYPPPDSTSGSSSTPAFNKTHPLGARARKLKTQGILTVRFEMPFAIWCGHCAKPTIIGQGVRFNAEKKKVGNYFSTPIWSFRLKHAVCGGAIEIRTDPKAAEYVVVEGAKRRDYGEERAPEEGGGEVVLDEEERRRRREDAMAGLEGKRDEEVVKKEAGRRIGELIEEREKWWGDPYEASRFVRKGFRRERKERHRERDKAEGIRERMGLGVELLPENEEDGRRAKLIEFGGVERVDASVKPLFDIAHVKTRGHEHQKATQTETRAERARIRQKEDFEQRVRSTTRASVDPFSSDRYALSNDSRISSVVNTIRRRDGSQPTSAAKPSTKALVAYDSD